MELNSRYRQPKTKEQNRLEWKRKVERMKAAGTYEAFREKKRKWYRDYYYSNPEKEAEYKKKKQIANMKMKLKRAGLEYSDEDVPMPAVTDDELDQRMNEYFKAKGWD